MESLRFEDRWKNAFDGAELTPMDLVWFSVESDLIAAENVKMKRTVVIYQRLAAASALFALMLGILSYNYWKDLSRIQLTQKNIEPKITTVVIAHNVKSAKEPLPNISKDRRLSRENSISKNKRGGQAGGDSPPKEPSGVTITPPDRERMVLTEVNTSAEKRVAPHSRPAGSLEDSLDMTMNRVRSLAMSEIIESPVKIKMAPVETIIIPANPASIQREKFTGEKLWAWIGIARGTYSPGGSGPSRANLASAQTAAPNQSGNSGSIHASFGTSNSVWVTIGHRISSRWNIQSGVVYLKQSLGYTSNLVSTASSPPQAFVSTYNPGTYSAVTTSYVYPINSVLEYVSIPVLAGYVIMNRKIGLQVNTGFSSDIFVRNSLQDETGLMHNFSKSSGSESPYRSVNWSGIASAELSYRVARQYSLSIVPGIRYSFNPALKTGSDRPSVRDIGFRFRYTLR
jgi:hypothetical protein